MVTTARTVVFGLFTLLLGCPGDDTGGGDDSAGECVDGYQVYVVWELQDSCGTACPEGSFEGYTDGDLLVCNACETETDCDVGEVCSADCGPGCEDDEGGCCPVYSCVAG